MRVGRVGCFGGGPNVYYGGRDPGWRRTRRTRALSEPMTRSSHIRPMTRRPGHWNRPQSGGTAEADRYRAGCRHSAAGGHALREELRQPDRNSASPTFPDVGESPQLLPLDSRPFEALTIFESAREPARISESEFKARELVDTTVAMTRARRMVRRRSAPALRPRSGPSPQCTRGVAALGPSGRPAHRTLTGFGLPRVQYVVSGSPGASAFRPRHAAGSPRAFRPSACAAGTDGPRHRRTPAGSPRRHRIAR